MGEATVCHAWHLRFLTDEPVRGGECRYCEREIAVPLDAGKRVTCLYCALQIGLVPAIDAPFAAKAVGG